MKRQSELVDVFCDDIKNLTKKIVGCSRGIANGNDYFELMSYGEFSDTIDVTKTKIESVLKKIMNVHPKLNKKMTVNEKVRPADEDVVTHCIDFLLEAVEIEQSAMKKPENFSVSYQPKCLRKYHSTYPTTTQPHPYINEINELVHQPWQLNKCNPEQYLSLENTPLVFVETVEQLQKLVISLNNVNQFAVDVEHHSEHSYYGFVCLIQISTRSQDFIIDAIKLRDYIHLLNDPFTNPKIEKIFHGSDYDMVWLSYNFGLYVINCFDSGQASRILKLQHFSLKYLIEKYCGLVIDKKYQLADWRIRPLTPEMLLYARQDTHYLLYITDLLRNECVEQEVLQEVLKKSNNLCLRLFSPTYYSDEYIERLSKKSWIKKYQYPIFKKLFLLRDQIAREEDESTNVIFDNSMLTSIINNMPTDISKLKLCCLPKIPYYVEMHSTRIIKCINEELNKMEEIKSISNDKNLQLSDSVEFVKTALDVNFRKAVVLQQQDFDCLL
ncbi:Exosome component 10 [Entamoeba marina]